jgi:hypothetical protein
MTEHDLWLDTERAMDSVMDGFYKRHAFIGLVMDAIGEYSKPTPGDRIHIAKRLAEAVEQSYHDPHLYCLEKLTNDKGNPQLWRDVLSFIEESKK